MKETRPDHPRLTKVLAEAWAAPAAGIDIDDTLARELIEGIPPDIADRLEAALDVCQRTDPDPAIGLCAEPESSEVHHRDLSVWPDESFWSHPYVPLVEVSHD